MARKLRLEYPGALYHVMNRGDRREAIFREDADRVSFLETLGQACVKTDWQVHAFCLMSNHFHLVVETPRGNLVAGMKWFLGTLTARFNRRHKLFGHLFSGRYKSLVMEGSQSGYLRTVCDYVHLNPALAGLITEGQPLKTYAWSSVREYLQAPSRRASWLRVDRLFGELGIPQDSAAGRRQFEALLEQRRATAQPQEWKPIRRGWCYGEEAFRQELLAQMHERAGAHHYGEELRESSKAKAERLVAEEMKRLGLTEADLQARRKGDKRKAKIARRLREQTPMTLAWIAQRLHVGSGSNVVHGLRKLKAL